VTTKSGLIIRPERITDLVEYPNGYIRSVQNHIGLYLREGGHEEDTVVVDAKRQIDRAEETITELKQLATEVQRIYELNFVREAEIVRRTLSTLGFTQLDQVQILSVLVEHMVTRFKEENPKFSEEKFRNYINKDDTEDPIIITRQVRRVSA
jgi:hypothetical protein